MAEIDFKVLITTSGVGQRLGELTKFTNKSLVRVGAKPALSYVIESYPKGTNFVITLGHFGNQVREFIELAYPDLNVEFVNVDNFEGTGSSLGYSMLQAKNQLQCPFIYQAHDTLILGQQIPRPDFNWVGVAQGQDTSQYASWKTHDNKIVSYNDKNALDFDFIHIGMIGIHNFKSYWEDLELLHKSDPDNTTLGEGLVITKMIEQKNEFKIIEFPRWLDVGNTGGLHLARKQIADGLENLDKVDESIYIFKNDFVIKFFYDEKIVKNRVERAKILTGLVPEILDSKKHFYKYVYQEGPLYSQVVDPENFLEFLNWTKTNLWKKIDNFDKAKLKSISLDFYKNKTEKRIEKFFTENSLKDEETIINGQSTPSMKNILNEIDWNWLSDMEPYVIHGDFILDNIIKTLNGFSLLDWRQDFGGMLEFGDIYYDFAKLNHNLTISHEAVEKNLFKFHIKSNVIICDIMRKQTLVDCQIILSKYINDEGFDEKKVHILTPLIWLNSAPLHHFPYNMFLFFYGKINLWRQLNQKN